LDVFFNNNPGGQVLGDGVHLSPRGKQRLADFLVSSFTSLPPLEVNTNPIG
jgi:lysophospholipase L1-like esterase